MKTYNTPNTTISAMAAQSLLMSSPTGGMTVGGGSNNPLQGQITGGNVGDAMAPSRKF